MTKPLNALIAEALGWRTWEDTRPDHQGKWFQERDGKPGFIEVRPVVDYLWILRHDLKMHTGDQLPAPNAHVVRTDD